MMSPPSRASYTLTRNHYPNRRTTHVSSSPTNPAVNMSTRKVGGIRFIKLGRFCLSFCVTQTYKDLNR